MHYEQYTCICFRNLQDEAKMRILLCAVFLACLGKFKWRTTTVCRFAMCVDRCNIKYISSFVNLVVESRVLEYLCLVTNNKSCLLVLQRANLPTLSPFVMCWNGIEINEFMLIIHPWQNATNGVTEIHIYIHCFLSVFGLYQFNGYWIYLSMKTTNSFN